MDRTLASVEVNIQVVIAEEPIHSLTTFQADLGPVTAI